MVRPTRPCASVFLALVLTPTGLSSTVSKAGWKAASKRPADDCVEVVNLGLVDNPFKAREAGHQFRREDVDLIFLHVTTYALSFTEYYAMDFNHDIVLMGHDGRGHIAIAQGKTRVRPLQVYHGKVGRGLSVEMCVKHGPATLLSVVQTVDGKLKFLMAEGESVPGPILEIGNTNSRYRFSIGARKFVENWNLHGPAHHCAIGVGHITGRLQKLAALLGIEAGRVC